MLITRDDLEAALEQVRSRVVDPRAGIHGPASAAWSLQRESLIFLGGGAAALLQLAHPYVAHAVDQHSATRRDVVGRFQRTFANVFAMSFGDLPAALAAARRVHAIHTRIHGLITEDVGAWRRGHRYHANDVDALLWVYATLVHTVVQVTELVRGPLGPGMRERYYRDTWSFAHLFGIPDRRLPPDWDAFAAYFERMCASDTIAIGAPARGMCRFLLTPPQRSHALLWRWIAIMTAGLLPPRLRRDYGLDMSRRDQRVFRASVRALGALYPVVPASLRYLPAYTAAERRMRGLEPGLLGRLMERAMLHVVGGSRGAARFTPR